MYIIITCIIIIKWIHSIKVCNIIIITSLMTWNIYTNIEAHTLRSKMNFIHERHVPSQEKPKSMNHIFLKIKRWRNNRQTKRNSRLCHHIALTTNFPMSQEFCNYDSVWESYVNFNESLQSSKMPKHFSSTNVRTFLQELQNTKERLDWWTNEMFDIIFIKFMEEFSTSNWADMQFKITNN